MEKYLIIYGLTSSDGDSANTMFEKGVDFCRAVQRHGLTWSGRGGTIVLRTETPFETLARDLVGSVGNDEFVAVIPIPYDPPVRYGGWLVNDEAFLELLPGAIDVTYEV